MSAARPGSGEIRNYLLRRMSEEERTAFESAYFADDRLLDQVEEEEDGLVSDYVLGRLPESDRRRFEESLLGSPYYRERVETTSRLKQRISAHRAFDRRGKGTAPAKPLVRRRSEDAAQPETGRLFPGRTGTVIAFAFLGVLLVAAVLSALGLRRALERSRAAAPAAPAPAERPSAAGAGVVPTAQSLVLMPSGTAGPALRRVSRSPGAPLMIVIPAQVLASQTHAFALLVTDPQGQPAWRSGRIPREPGTDTGDLALRLPPGIPADGRSAVTLLTEGPAGHQELALGLLDLATAAR